MSLNMVVDIGKIFKIVFKEIYVYNIIVKFK